MIILALVVGAKIKSQVFGRTASNSTYTDLHNTNIIRYLSSGSIMFSQ